MLSVLSFVCTDTRSAEVTSRLLILFIRSVLSRIVDCLLRVRRRINAEAANSAVTLNKGVQQCVEYEDNKYPERTNEVGDDAETFTGAFRDSAEQIPEVSKGPGGLAAAQLISNG